MTHPTSGTVNSNYQTFRSLYKITLQTDCILHLNMLGSKSSVIDVEIINELGIKPTLRHNNTTGMINLSYAF